MMTCLTMTLSMGCVSVKSPNVKYPIIDAAQRPTLSTITKDELSSVPQETLQKLLENDQKLKTHISRLEAQIKTYNDWAKNQP